MRNDHHQFPIVHAVLLMAVMACVDDQISVLQPATPITSSFHLRLQ